MAFIVEDGTGVAGATSYTTVEFADDYFAERGGAVWAAIAEDSDKESFLIQATDYIELVYGRRFLGEMSDATQALSWPRTDADPYAEGAIPINLEKATAEYAIRAIAGPLLPDPAVDANGFATVVTKKVIGPIEKEFRVMGGSRRLIRNYPVPDSLMFPLLMPGTGGTRVTR